MSSRGCEDNQAAGEEVGRCYRSEDLCLLAYALCLSPAWFLNMTTFRDTGLNPLHGFVNAISKQLWDYI